MLYSSSFQIFSMITWYKAIKTYFNLMRKRMLMDADLRLNKNIQLLQLLPLTLSLPSYSMKHEQIL